MERTSVRVAVKGCGVISARVAGVIPPQDDSQLIGATDVIVDYRTKLALEV